jgi:hypothetical protein
MSQLPESGGLEFGRGDVGHRCGPLGDVRWRDSSAGDDVVEGTVGNVVARWQRWSEDRRLVSNHVLGLRMNELHVESTCRRQRREVLNL